MGYRDSREEYFEDLMVAGAPIQETEYGLFKEHYRDVASALDSMKSSKLSLEQIREAMVEHEETAALTGKELERVMDHYDNLGIVTSEVKTFDRRKVYRIPSYSGRGTTKSWPDIVDELEQDMKEAEETHCWNNQGEGIYDITEYE